MNRYASFLRELIEGLQYTGLENNPEITGISSDSRQVQAGDLFIALKGEQADARQYIGQALERGAVAVLVDAHDQPSPGQEYAQAENLLIVNGLRQVLSRIAARFYRFPSRQIKVIGITGTNGKTTIAWILAQVLSHLGIKAGMMGTLGVGSVDDLDDTGMTTPDAVQVQKHLAHMLNQGVEAVCLEVSSHALELGRVSDVRFEAVVYSNLSQDHLDFHQTMEQYARAKKRLFKEYEYKFVVVNVDDELGRDIVAGLELDALTYGVDHGWLRATDIRLVPQGLAFRMGHEDHRVAVNTMLIGDFNVYNLLAVSGVAVSMGYAIEDVARAIEVCKAVPGRMERVHSHPDQPVVVVDYAHTPDALDKALTACRGHCAGSLAVVFGCGGDRDRAKRPIMGRIAERAADTVYITDDNPRSEKSAVIVADIARQMHKPAWVLHDRAQAIQAAIGRAHTGDWVLIAGKGHETRQVYADQVIELDDRVLARQALQRVAA